MPRTAHGSAHERVGVPTHQQRCEKSQTWNKVGTPTRMENGKWERSQASGKAHNQVWKSNEWNVTPLIKEQSNPKSFQRSKLQPQYTPPTTVKTPTDSLCPQRRTTTIVATAIECKWVFASSSTTATPIATTEHLVTACHQHEKLHKRVEYPHDQHERWNNVKNTRAHQITRITHSSEDWKNSSGCPNVHTTQLI